MPRFRLALAVVLGFAGPALAQSTAAVPPVPEAAPLSPQTVALARAMRLDDLFAVLREEGLAYGVTLETDMLPSGGGPGWEGAVSDIYDAASLRARFDAVLQAELGNDPGLVQEIVTFFSGDLGVRVLGLEIEARRAFLDEASEDAARVAADKRRAGRDPRQAQIDRFVAAGDLLEMNVAGALSGNLAFLTGMSDSGVYGQSMPQDQILADVWGQEAQIRDETTSWLNAYLGLAYQPLTEAELDDYIAFMESPAGKRLSAALFVAFDKVFRQVSYKLGRQVGLAMQGNDI